MQLTVYSLWFKLIVFFFSVPLLFIEISAEPFEIVPEKILFKTKAIWKGCDKLRWATNRKAEQAPNFRIFQHPPGCSSIRFDRPTQLYAKSATAQYAQLDLLTIALQARSKII